MHFPKKLTKVGNLSLPDHYHLKEDYLCWFLGEYTAYEGFSYSDTNQLIVNLKNPTCRRGKPEWKQKGRAIRTAAAALKDVIHHSWPHQPSYKYRPQS